MNEPATAIAAIHCVATLFMAGVIWFVQIVHYPLLALIPPDAVPTYEREHARRTGWVLAPVMFTELGTAVLLLWLRPSHVPLTLAVSGAATLVLIWIVTWTASVPCHNRLCEQFDPAVHRRLVRSNWHRTIAWSTRAMLAVYFIVQ
jgi:hypothetical protein